MPAETTSETVWITLSGVRISRHSRTDLVNTDSVTAVQDAAAKPYRCAADIKTRAAFEDG